jgi:hypothetical protein
MTLDETKNILINKAKNSQIPKGEKRKYSSHGSFAQKILKEDYHSLLQIKKRASPIN